MAQVTYRGVKYNTEDNRQAKAPKTRTLVYRGVEYTVEAKWDEFPKRNQSTTEKEVCP